MNTKKKWTQLITGVIILVIGITAMAFSRSAGVAEDAGDLSKALYSGSIILALIGIIVSAAALIPPAKPLTAKQLATAGVLAALSYVGFAFFKIDIPVGAEKTAFHLGNVFCVLAALLIGGLWGGLAGAAGMTIGDLLTGYVTSAPKTFFLKLCIGLVVGLVAYRLLHIDKETDKKKLTWKTAVSAMAGMAFNVVADPIVGYLYKRYLFGLAQDLAKALAKIGALTTFVNAVIAVIVATIFYLALRPALKKAGLLDK